LKGGIAVNNRLQFTERIRTTPPLNPSVNGRGWGKIIKSHFRRLTLEVLNIFINHDWIFWLIGRVNRQIGLIESVFLVYPATEEYGLWFAYRYRLKVNLWRPWPTGLLYQNRKLTVMFAIAANNGQYTDPANTENLRQVSARMEKLRQLLGANRKTFAGILPGVLYYKRIIHEAPEADLTAQAVLQAVDLVKCREKLASDTKIIVLGGKGFIGRRVVKLLDKSTTFSIDSADGQGKDDWPSNPTGQRIIVLNITVNNSISDYIASIQPGTVVINEVYPEPTSDVLEKLAAKECRCYHIVGVEALALPQFPLAYQGAVPCCAAWPSAKMKVVIRKVA
jgi:hypothetical protein